MSDEIIPWEVDTRITGLQEEIEQLRGQVVALVADLGNREDFIKRLLEELSNHAWNHNEKRPEVHALLDEGRAWLDENRLRREKYAQYDCIQPIAYKVRRKNDGVEYGPFETLVEARIWLGNSDSKELICIYPGEASNEHTTDATTD